MLTLLMLFLHLVGLSGLASTYVESQMLVESYPVSLFFSFSIKSDFCLLDYFEPDMEKALLLGFFSSISLSS